MSIMPIIGLIGVRNTSSFKRSWLTELEHNVLLFDDIISIHVSLDELTRLQISLPYSAIIVRVDDGLSKEQCAFLRYIDEVGIPIVVGIETCRGDLWKYADILGRASLVATGNDGVATIALKYSNRVFLFTNLPNTFAGAEPEQPDVPVSIVDRRWLWICDPLLCVEAFDSQLGIYEKLSNSGHSGAVTAVHVPSGLVFPDWMETLEVPDSVIKFGCQAMIRWLVASKNRWDSVYWEDGDDLSSAATYVEMGLKRWAVDKHGNRIEAMWPPQPSLSFASSSSSRQKSILSAVLPGQELQREELFDGLVCYDKGRAIARQRSAFPDRCVFREALDPSQLPLVSILIPAYNRPEYLEQALESALFQTYPNLEIIIGDDSTTDDVEKLILSKYLPKYPNIFYWRNAQNKGQFQNDLDLIQASNGDYINILMDDDLLHLDKIRQQMSHFLGSEGASVGLVTSHRAVIGPAGEFQKIFSSTETIFNETVRLDGREAIEQSMRMNRNFFGEPTTVLFRKSMLGGEFGSLFGRRYVCNVDHSSWLQILQSGDAVFVDSALSAYRFHVGQQSWTPRAALGGAVDFCHATWELHGKGYLAEQEGYLLSLKKCVERAIAEQGKITDLSTLDAETLELYANLSSYRTLFERTIAELSPIVGPF